MGEVNKPFRKLMDKKVSSSVGKIRANKKYNNLMLQNRMIDHELIHQKNIVDSIADNGINKNEKTPSVAYYNKLVFKKIDLLVEMHVLKPDSFYLKKQLDELEVQYYGPKQLRGISAIDKEREKNQLDRKDNALAADSLKRQPQKIKRLISKATTKYLSDNLGKKASKEKGCQKEK